MKVSKFAKLQCTRPTRFTHLCLPLYYEVDLHGPGIPSSLASGWICPWGSQRKRVRSRSFSHTWLAAPAKLPTHRAAHSGLPLSPSSLRVLPSLSWATLTNVISFLHVVFHLFPPKTNTHLFYLEKEAIKENPIYFHF